MIKNKLKVLSLEGQFTWLGDDKFFIETPSACFIWSDPNNKGNNTLVEYNGTYADFIEESKAKVMQDQGFHSIRSYCGDDIRLVLAEHH